LYRSEGASTVKNGRPPIRPAHGTTVSTCIEIQRSPLALTAQCLRSCPQAQTGSR